MRHRVQGQDLLETEPCEHREMTTGSQFKGRDEHGALQCDLQRCCVGQGHSSTGHAAPNQRHAAGSQRPPVIPRVGMDRAPAKRAAEELHGASGKSSQRVRMSAVTFSNRTYNYVQNLPIFHRSYYLPDSVKRAHSRSPLERPRVRPVPGSSRRLPSSPCDVSARFTP